MEKLSEAMANYKLLTMLSSFSQFEEIIRQEELGKTSHLNKLKVQTMASPAAESNLSKQLGTSLGKSSKNVHSVLQQ